AGGGVMMTGDGIGSGFGSTGADAVAVSFVASRSSRRRSSANSTNALLARFDVFIATTSAITATTAIRKITQPCMDRQRIHAGNEKARRSGPLKIADVSFSGLVRL